MQLPHWSCLPLLLSLLWAKQTWSGCRPQGEEERNSIRVRTPRADPRRLLEVCVPSRKCRPSWTPEPWEWALVLGRWVWKRQSFCDANWCVCFPCRTPISLSLPSTGLVYTCRFSVVPVLGFPRFSWFLKQNSIILGCAEMSADGVGGPSYCTGSCGRNLSTGAKVPALRRDPCSHPIQSGRWLNTCLSCRLSHIGWNQHFSFSGNCRGLANKTECVQALAARDS